MCSWDPGSWILHPGSLIHEPESWSLDPGSTGRIQDISSWIQDVGCRILTLREYLLYERPLFSCPYFDNANVKLVVCYRLEVANTLALLTLTARGQRFRLEKRRVSLGIRPCFEDSRPDSYFAAEWRFQRKAGLFRG